jgi:hypothetical protein
MARREPRRPTFLYIGPDRSGSTWLFEILRRHPECFVPRAKDIYFFDRHHQRGLGWYLGFFKNAPPGAKALGELSHDYMLSPEAGRRIRRDLPDVLLLTCLRNPVERTFSHWLYLVRSGLTRLTFEDALESHPRLVDNSLYHAHLAPYFELFPEPQLSVLFFDDLQADPVAFARRVFGLLGVSFVPGLPYQERILPASRPRSATLARLAKLGANATRLLGSPNLVGRVKRSRLAGLLYVPYGKDEKPRLAPDTAARLRERFRPDVLALGRRLSVDLGHWLAEPEREQP